MPYRVCPQGQMLVGSADPGKVELRLDPTSFSLSFEIFLFSHVVFWLAFGQHFLQLLLA
jgi:hypothetical protein